MFGMLPQGNLLTMSATIICFIFEGKNTQEFALSMVKTKSKECVFVDYFFVV